MEFAVRLVGGIESCFVSLPLYLIGTLQSAFPGGALPPLLSLELRSRDGHSWNVAWTGAASSSPAIEVSRYFAECISLVDDTNVQVKVVSTLPKAILATVEPDSEDDWEILELNSELAEDAILKQVGVVYKGMRFPLWLHGHTVVLFHVVSVSPEKPVVQLVPGTEVAVVPKTRKTKMDSHQQINKSSSKGKMKMKALLRVQIPMNRVVHRFEFQDFELGVVMTSVAFIHPETARHSSFDNLHVVSLIPRSSRNKAMQNLKDGASRSGSNVAAEEASETASISTETSFRNVLVHLLFSDTVAKGHIRLPQSLQLYLGVNTHSWVYVKGYATSTRKELPLMRLSPCRFKVAGRQKLADNSSSYNPMDHKISRRKNLPPSVASLMSAESMDWSIHEELPTLLWSKAGVDIAKVLTTKEIKYLICIWLVGQIKAMASCLGENEISLTSVVLSNESLLHFEIMRDKFRGGKHQLSSGVPLNEKKPSGESTIEILYLLSNVSRESSRGCQDEFEISLGVDYNKMSPQDFKLVAEKLEFGEPVSISSIIEHSSYIRSYSATVSSLSWMETAISQTVDRLTVLLSPACRKLLDTFNLPPPGHILIHGPAVIQKIKGIMNSALLYLKA